tara:strand:- start:30991 stop:32115 length:1125 start_codon:yes stop_codon:yes gene_type:complete
MPKICHFSSSHRPDDTRVAHKEVNSLSQYFDDVTLVTHHHEKLTKIFPSIHYVDTGVSMPQKRWQRITIGAWRVYRAAVKVNADIYHFHDPELLPYVIALRLRRKKVIYDVHEDLAKDIRSKVWIPKVFRSIIATMVDLVEKTLSRFCSAVVPACEPMTEIFYPYNKNTIAINNYPELALYPSQPGLKKRQACYLGTITRTRGIKQAIEACHRANIKLVLGGNFHDEILFAECKAMPGWENVEWLGYIPHDQAIAIISQSLVGLLLQTFTQHYQPIKLYEYMASGIPVIASDYQQWIDIVEKNKLGFCVDPHSIDSICEALNQLLADESMAQQMGAQAKDYVSQHYSWEQEAQKLYKLYESLASPQAQSVRSKT